VLNGHVLRASLDHNQSMDSKVTSLSPSGGNLVKYPKLNNNQVLTNTVKVTSLSPGRGTLTNK